MTLKHNQPTCAPYLKDGVTAAFSEPNSPAGITLDDQAQILRRARFQFNAVVIDVTAALDYASVLVCELPDTNLMIMSVEADMTIVKGGVTNGIVATKDLSVGIGTGAAAANPPAGSALSILNLSTLTPDTLSVEYEVHGVNTADGDPGALPSKFADTPTRQMYLNIGVVGGITVDDTVTVTGTLDVVYLDLGNAAS